MDKYQTLLEAPHFYHIYNRGNNGETLFKTKRNYTFFLGKWDHYLNKFIDVWSYCLMPNHFHFLIKVRSEKELSQDLKTANYSTLSHFISNQFRKLFISYTKSFNKAFDRSGSLFQKPFKRIKIDDRNYLLHIIHYIHHNPIHHNFVEDYNQWPYSSYQAVLSDKPTRVNRDGILRLFGSKKRFRSIHKQQKDYKKISHLLVE